MQNTLITLLFTLFIVLSDYLIMQIFSPLLSGLFFALILFITHFCKHSKIIYLVIFTLGSIHHLFYSYFQRTITSTDIYLFFTHMEETFESFSSMLYLFTLPFIILLSGLLLLWKLPNSVPHSLKPWIRCPVLLLLSTLNLHSTMGMQLIHVLTTLSFDKPKIVQYQETPLYSQRTVDTNIILLIGESMKCNSYIEAKLKKQGFFYKKVYTGATNTDVAIPLLLNAKTNPLKLNHKNETNLFRLAKRNQFTTTFISMQSEKSLQYIKPHLQTSQIDNYKSYTKEKRKPTYDFLLLEHLKAMDWNQHHFIVMQQIGQHSPYYFFPNASSDLDVNYYKSIDYSFKLYKEMYDYLKTMEKPFIFIYVSDHGEFTGEGGRYGHNTFEPLIYEVPMFMVSNYEPPQNYQKVESHYHLSQLITYLLGYKKNLEFSQEKSIVNGTMLSREDGFIEVEGIKDF